MNKYSLYSYDNINSNKITDLINDLKLDQNLSDSKKLNKFISLCNELNISRSDIICQKNIIFNKYDDLCKLILNTSELSIKKCKEFIFNLRDKL